MFSLKQAQLIFSDVDETVADVYTPATDGMVQCLIGLLEHGKALVFISGQSKGNIFRRFIDRIPVAERKRILVCECSGAAVWGFSSDGAYDEEPVYSLYDLMMSDAQKTLWRVITATLIKEFGFTVKETMPKPLFREIPKNDPPVIMLADRGAQITFELVNCEDLRDKLAETANKMFDQNKLPLDAHKAGNFAVDMTLKGISKSTAVREIVENYHLLRRLGAPFPVKPAQIMVWGDKFSLVNGGTDMHILRALDPKTPTIDFRREPAAELDTGYNIQVWTGREALHHGLEEYLREALKKI